MNDLRSLKTPCLLLDVERVRHNAVRLNEITGRNGVRLRPHVKTHKCVEVARIQTAGHDGGLTVSTLAEAWAFARHGFNDLTYAVPIEPGKFAEAIELVQSGVKLHLLTDDAETPPALNSAAQMAGVRLSLFVKIDCGYHRCGVGPHTKEAHEIPRLLAGASNLHFAGLLTHAGHSYHAQSVEEISAIARHERDALVGLAEKLRAEGLPVPTVSIGSTPTINHIDHLRGIDEVRPGNYIFYDAFQAALGSCGFGDCALTVLAAVTHRSREQRQIIVDAGAIALSKDRGAVEFDPACGYGRVWALDGRELNLRIESLSQEHGVMKVADESVFDKLKVGSRVRILANHSCLAAAQHEVYNVLENGAVTGRWKIHRGW